MCHGPVNYRSHLSSWVWDGYLGEAFVQTGMYGFVGVAAATYQEIARVVAHLVRKIPFEWVRESMRSPVFRVSIFL